MPAQSAIETVRSLRDIRETHERTYAVAERSALLQARSEGASWEEIARALGRNRASVWQKCHEQAD